MMPALEGDWVMIYMTASMAVTPVVLLLTFPQKQFIAGATMGALRW